MAPFNGLFAISHFYHLFFTSTLIRRDYCPIQGSFAYLYPHSMGLLPHSGVFLQQAILNLFFYFYLHSKGLLPHSRVFLQSAILSLFFYLYPRSKGLLPYSRVILQQAILSLFFYFYPHSKGLSMMMMCASLSSSSFLCLFLGLLFGNSL